MVQPIERADARANRARVIEAAHAVFRVRGLDAEMKEIAERAGLGVGTIYRNFPSKDDLLTAIIGEAIRQMQANVEAAMRIADPVEAVRTFLRGGFALIDRYGDLVMAMHKGDLPPACKEQFEQVDKLDLAGGLLRKGTAAGVFRTDLDLEVAAATLVASFVPWNYQQFRRSHTPEQIVDALLDLFLRGVLRA